MKLTKYSEAIARKALEMGAIRLSPEAPFRWASGYYMPIYNDNRSFLGDYQARRRHKHGWNPACDNTC